MIRPDQEPGFWPNYQPPTTHVGAAVQYPMDERWSDRVMTAYARDAAAARKGKK